MRQNFKVALYTMFLSFTAINGLYAGDVKEFSEDIQTTAMRVPSQIGADDRESSKNARFNTKEVLETAAKAVYKNASWTELEEVASKTSKNIKSDFERIDTEGGNYFSKVFSVIKNVGSGIIEYVTPIAQKVLTELGPVLLNATATFIFQTLVATL